MDRSYHPACLLFPRLPEDDLQALADDIRQNGLLNPIVTLDGQILDGRNRLAACKIAGVKPKFMEWDGEGSPLAWVVAINLVRRHLTASQRAVVAFDLLPMLEAEAKERQRQSPGRGKKVAKELATFLGKPPHGPRNTTTPVRPSKRVISMFSADSCSNIEISNGKSIPVTVIR